MAFNSAGNGYLAGNTGGSFSGFSNAGNSDLFVVGYDSAGSPMLLQQLGTSGDEYPYDMEVDVSGNIYLTGSTEGGLRGRSNSGEDDTFVMKLDSAGNVLWTRLFGGAGSEVSHGVGVDDAGHAWIAGRSASSFGGHTNAGGGRCLCGPL